MVRIAVVSQDRELWRQLEELLTGQGFDVEALEEGSGNGWDRSLLAASLVILDESPDSGEAFALLRYIRKSCHTPVFMILEGDGAERRISSLEAGADDCLGRPFHPRELTARVRSILRRPSLDSRTDAMHPIEANGVRLAPASREVFLDGHPVGTTTVEFEILAVLMRSAGKPVSRDQLMESLYHRKATAFDRSIDMHVSHLRRKLGGADRPLIKTVRGAGYQFCLPGETAD